MTKNAEVVAGTGEQCLPFDEARCGDGGKAVEATLMSPKGTDIYQFGDFFLLKKRGGRKSSWHLIVCNAESNILSPAVYWEAVSHLVFVKAV